MFWVWLQVFGIAIGLAMDAFAVAVATGLTLPQVTPRHTFRLSFHFGLFQFLMPILGWAAGSVLAVCVDRYDHWVAFGLLGAVGLKMLADSLNRDESAIRTDPTRGFSLVTLSVATSLDALAVGFSLALVGVSVWGASVLIGVVAATLTAVGILFGSRLGSRWAHRAEALGGCVLMAIGLKILVDGISKL